MIKNIVLIPIYKETPDENEVKSLVQALNVFKDQKIIFFGPENLDTKLYKDKCSEALYMGVQREFVFEKFNKDCFQNLNTYSALMLDPEFYLRFLNYNYMLIYQLDAYVFEDELDIWCDMDYDYIGAPWFKGLEKSTEQSPLLSFAGNGGFSLRHIANTHKLLSKLERKVNHNFFWATFNHVGYKLKLKQLKNWFSYAVKPYRNLIEELDVFEDIVLARLSRHVYSNYQVAPPKVALKFSFERNPEILYRLNDKQLPFGCHAWGDFHQAFWYKFIK